MKAILRRTVLWKEETFSVGIPPGDKKPSVLRSASGLKVIDVPECFGVGMGLMIDGGCDPEIPESIWSNFSGSLVIEIEDHNTSLTYGVPSGAWLAGWKKPGDLNIYTATINDVTCLQEEWPRI